MENPVAPPAGLAPDLDSIMQRVRDAVQQRSQPDKPIATLGSDGNLFSQLELVLREQSAANEAMLESFAEIVGELRELQDHARHLGDARAQDSDRQTEEIRELQEQVERNSDIAGVIAKELDTITSRVYQLEPNVDAEIAKNRIAVREMITASAATAEARLREIHETLSAGQKQAIEAGVAQISEAQTAATEAIAALKAESDQRLSQLEARLEQVDLASASSADAVNDLRRWIEEAHAAMVTHTTAIERDVGQHRATSDERNTADLARLTQLESAMTEMTASIAAIAETAAQSRTELLSQTAAQNERVHRLNAVLVAEIGSLQHRIDGIAAADRNEQLAKSVEDLSVRMQSAEQAVQERVVAREEQVRALQSEVEEKEMTAVARLTQLESAMTDLNQSVSQLQQTTGGLSGELHSVIASHQERLDRVDSTAAEEFARLRQQLDAVNVAELSASLHGLTTRLDATDSALSAQTPQLEQRINDAVDALNRRLAQLESIGTSSTAKSVDKPTPSAQPAPAPALSYDVGRGAFDYLSFEHRWRGTVADITLRQSAYVDLFRGCGHVLDLGCGRGEFVQLLVENGISVNGIDGNADMVRFCQEKNLPVQQAEILAYLPTLNDSSIGAITAFQVIEHLAPDALVSLLDLSVQKLAPGGTFLAETINPNCPLALSNFFLDPTHVRPYPAATLTFMCRQRGLEVQFIRYTAPGPSSAAPASVDVTTDGLTDISEYQDYALIAKKPDSTAPAEAHRAE